MPPSVSSRFHPLAATGWPTLQGKHLAPRLLSLPSMAFTRPSGASGLWVAAGPFKRMGDDGVKAGGPDLLPWGKWGAEGRRSPAGGSGARRGGRTLLLLLTL